MQRQSRLLQGAQPRAGGPDDQDQQMRVCEAAQVRGDPGGPVALEGGLARDPPCGPG